MLFQPRILFGNAVYVQDQTTTTYFQKESNGYWLYIDEQKFLAFMGIVYQPTMGDKHIREYKQSLAKLYSPLLPTHMGGMGHAKRLKELGITAIRVYELPTFNSSEIDSVKKIFRYIYNNFAIRVLIGEWAGLYSTIDWSKISFGIRFYLQEQSETQLERIMVPTSLFLQNVESEFQIVGSRLRRLVRTYCNEPWVLGWQIGNENNYYTVDGKLGDQIRLTSVYLTKYPIFIIFLPLCQEERPRSKSGRKTGRPYCAGPIAEPCQNKSLNAPR